MVFTELYFLVQITQFLYIILFKSFIETVRIYHNLATVPKRLAFIIPIKANKTYSVGPLAMFYFDYYQRSDERVS